MGISGHNMEQVPLLREVFHRSGHVVADGRDIAPGCPCSRLLGLYRTRAACLGRSSHFLRRLMALTSVNIPCSVIAIFWTVLQDAYESRLSASCAQRHAQHGGCNVVVVGPFSIKYRYLSHGVQEAVLSCPVYHNESEPDSPNNDDSGDEVLGFVDLRDIMRGFIIFTESKQLGSMKMLQRMKVCDCAPRGAASVFAGCFVQILPQTCTNSRRRAPHAGSRGPRSRVQCAQAQPAPGRDRQRRRSAFPETGREMHSVGARYDSIPPQQAQPPHPVSHAQRVPRKSVASPLYSFPEAGTSPEEGSSPDSAPSWPRPSRLPRLASHALRPDVFAARTRVPRGAAVMRRRRRRSSSGARPTPGESTWSIGSESSGQTAESRRSVGGGVGRLPSTGDGGRQT